MHVLMNDRFKVGGMRRMNADGGKRSAEVFNRKVILCRRILFILLLLTFCHVPLLRAAEGDASAKRTVSSDQDSSFDKDFGDDFDKDFAGNGQEEQLIADPLITLNRGVFWVNDKLYFYLLKPVARGYRYTVPKPARSSVGNFFSNLSTPIRAGNALLQLNFYDFGTEVYRFIVNTTLGIGGLFDPADSLIGIKKKERDFGLTLGYYGVGQGFYLVLPLIGPSSLRDATGSVVDTFLDPLKYSDLKTAGYLGAQSFKTVNWLSLDPDTYEGIIRDSLDPYLFMRDAYAQRRMALTGKSEYTIQNMNISNGSGFDFDIVNPLRWLGM